MSTRKVVRPLFPQAPADYSQNYTAEVVRAFSVFLEQVQNPGDLRATSLTLTDLQDNNQGLETGAIFQVNGVLHITLANQAYLAGTSATTAVGQVTVNVREVTISLLWAIIHRLITEFSCERFRASRINGSP